VGIINMQFILDLAVAGLVALKDYVATHVLTCLIPAFLLAGAMVAFINKQAIYPRRPSEWRRTHGAVYGVGFGEHSKSLL
jgi:uncharacterized membrane protein YraQ (UPF0718 family)